MEIYSATLLHNRKILFIMSLILNIALVILAIPGVVMNMKNHGIPLTFLYYTQDSNLFLGIVAVVYSIAAIISIKKGIYQIPKWIRQMKYYSVCCIGITFFVVLFILAPMAKPLGGLKWIFFTDSMLFQHLLSPVIAILEFIFLEHLPELPVKNTCYALIPTLIYAAVLYPLNIAKIVDGPYPFLQVHNMSIYMAILWFIIILVLSYNVGWFIWFLNRRTKKLFLKELSK